MPRSSLLLLLGGIVVCSLCYARTDRPRVAGTLAQLFSLVHSHHVDEVDEEKLFAGALRGMTETLDEHSEYINPQDSAEFNESLEQHFAGVGIEVMLSPKTRRLTVRSPMPGGPAIAAGMVAGDTIVKIDSESTDGFSLDDAVKRMRGPEGKAVTLTIARVGESQPHAVRLERASIETDTVRGERRLVDGNWDYQLGGYPHLGYARITGFGEQTSVELAQAIADMSDQGVLAIVLDLRGNPGGLLDVAVEICGLFVEAGKVAVTTRMRGGVVEEELRCESFEKDFPAINWPVAVLIDEDSASASEVVAACLQDYERATIIGTRSYGKGTVQRLHEIGGNRGLLKLTEASYWRPSGKNIHRGKRRTTDLDWGVMPDVGHQVKSDERTIRYWSEIRTKRDILPSETVPLPEFLTLRPEQWTQQEPIIEHAAEVLLNELNGAEPTGEPRQ